MVCVIETLVLGVMVMPPMKTVPPIRVGTCLGLPFLTQTVLLLVFVMAVLAAVLCDLPLTNSAALLNRLTENGPLLMILLPPKQQIVFLWFRLGVAVAALVTPPVSAPTVLFNVLTFML